MNCIEELLEHVKNLKWEAFMEKLQTSNMSPPESCYGLWYNPEINKFIDEDGFIMHDFHDLFDVWQLDQWKKQKEYAILIDRKGNLCEIYYVEPNHCENNCMNCGSKCEVYILWKDWRHESLEY